MSGNTPQDPINHACDKVCPDCGMSFTGITSSQALKSHKRDVHQLETRVTFAGSGVETVLRRDANGNFNCPLAACPLVTSKPGSIRAHCRRRAFMAPQGVAPIAQGSLRGGTISHPWVVPVCLL